MPKPIWIAVSLLAAVVSLGFAAIWALRWSENGKASTPVSHAASSETNHFVDNQACAECHADHFATHRKTGHADTFHRSDEMELARWLDGKTFVDPERDYVYEYHFAEQAGLAVSIPQIGEDRFPLAYALGSGQHAVTFLTLVPNRFGDTVGIEHRVTLYSGESGWELDLTPGHRRQVPRQEVEHFGKPIQGDTLTQCIACHTTEFKINRQDIVDLTPHVGCQSCHGPGRQHIDAMEQGSSSDYAGFTRQSAAEEVEMCGRCHRLAHSEPGVEISPNDIRIVRFQSVGLLQSRCFQESDGRLRCTTCHDPHQSVSRDASHYVDRCLDCHGAAHSAPCPISPQSGCIACHMPAIDIHRGIKFHDHWIRVRADLRSPP